MTGNKAAGSGEVSRRHPMPLVDPVHRFVLFLNPKCGGSTMKAWFFANLGLGRLGRQPTALIATFGPRYALRHLRFGRRLVRRVEGAAEQDAYRAAVKRLTSYYRVAYCVPTMDSGSTSGFFRICVTRNPYDRIVSAYLDKFCGKSRGESWALEVVEAAGRDGGLSFDKFLGYLKTVDDRACNPHWRRQTYILDGQRIDAFVRLERLESEMAALAGVVGSERLSLLSKKLNASGAVGGTKGAAKDLTGVSSLTIAADCAAGGGLPDPACFLTPDAKSQIQAIYAADFERLRYTP